MKAAPFSLLLAMAAVDLLSCSRSGHDSPPPVAWPPLSEFPAVSGRAATAEDVSAGRAVFVASDAGKSIGEPLSIALPQYAFQRTAGQRVPCVIIQAEQARDQQMVGAILLPKRTFAVGTLRDFDLLGTTPPHER
ncbi:MAG: hypothetical protein ABI787_06875 [Spartobacteria bacterium]